MSKERQQCTASSDAGVESTGIAVAIAEQQRVVQLTPQDHADLPTQLNNLWSLFQARFITTGDLADAAEAISAQQRALQLTPEGHPDRPGWLTDLGTSFSSRFDQTGDLADISAAIAAEQQAVSLTPEGHVELPDMLNNLGISLSSRFSHTGNFADIEEAILAQRRAVQLTPKGHTILPSRLTNLGNFLASRFEQTGDLADISEAISAQHQAVQLTSEGQADLPARLSNLGASFNTRFDRTRDLSDIAEAISAQRQAVLLSPEGRPELPAMLNNLGNSLGSRFDYTKNLDDITEAVSSLRRAVQLTPDDHADLRSRLNNLGLCLDCRFECTGELPDISEAISVQQKAILLTPQSHADLPAMLNNIGNSFQSRFNHTGDMADIADAISSQQQAIEITPEGHADLPSWHYSVGISLYKRATKISSFEDLDVSISHFRSAAMSTFGTPQTRLKAARRWTWLLNVHDPVSPDTILAFDTAVHLLTLVAGLEQTVEGRYSRLRDATGFVLGSVSAACRLQRPDKAVEWLEQGRCLVWRQLNNLRMPFDDLRAHDSQLAEKLTDTARQLESATSTGISLDPSMDMADKIWVEEEARSRLGLAREWNDLLAMARSIPGFESFLQPAPCSLLLQHLPEIGSVVIINAAQGRCDAFTLSTGLEQPLHISLPNFSPHKASEYRRALHTQLRSRDIRTRESDEGIDGTRALRRWKKPVADELSLREVLRGLWNDVVKPILNALGYLNPVSASSGALLPRIWWCPTGAMSFLPIHAAGLYGKGNSESTMDYVVSSYTPTITAIADRVKASAPIDNAVSGLFLTSQPNAPDACPIPGTTTEVECIHAKALDNGTRTCKRVGSELSVQNCLQSMEEFSSVHLACHASQNAEDPLQSRFLLHDGELTLETIIQMNFKNADLAFLSACQTSTGEERLSDEAVHLAAGMLAAGYRRVVATMWPISDQHAPDVAGNFYDYLWSHRGDGSGGSFDGSLSAHALHHSVQNLRQHIGDSEESLLTWVPYVHFGY